MATAITFSLNATTGFYEYSYTSDGTARVYQIYYDNTAAAVAGNNSRKFVFVQACLDSTTLDYAPLGQVDCSQDFNRTFRVDVPANVLVKLASPLPISAAAYISD